MKDRIREIDALRALALFIVLLHHLPLYSFNFYDLTHVGINYDMSFLNEYNRFFGIGLFVFISGYLIGKRTHGFDTWEKVRAFAVKRWMRIFPLYWLALVVFDILLDNRPEGILGYFLHFMGMQLIFASESNSPVMTLWFVGLVTVYYGLYALVHRGVSSDRGQGICAICLGTMIILLRQQDIMDPRILIYYGVFVTGIVVRRMGGLTVFSPKIIVILTCIFAAIIKMGGVTVYDSVISLSSKEYVVTLESIVHVIIVNILIIWLIVISYYATRVLVRKEAISSGIQKVAFCSYGAYLYHRPVWRVMKRILDIDGTMLEGSLLVVVGIPLILIGSYYLQRAYDDGISRMVEGYRINR